MKKPAAAAAAKPRGRPRKPVELHQAAQAIADAVRLAPVPKRGRGRPRKTPLPAGQAVDTHRLALVPETVVAERLRLSLSFLRKDRLGKRLIPYVQLGKSIRYDLAEVESAVKAMRRGGSNVSA